VANQKNSDRPVGHIILEVEDMFTKKPDARKKEDYKQWKESINTLIKECNTVGKFKYYSIIK
jgi:hypothetical protein